MRHVSKYQVFSGPYFLVFGPEKTLYFDTFDAVLNVQYGKIKTRKKTPHLDTVYTE